LASRGFGGNIFYTVGSNSIEIDGGFGEGGGQIVRTSLSLAAVLGVPVRIFNIRAGRPKPGLGNQHLAAARAACKVTRGELTGATKGSTELAFEPGPVRSGRYTREVGTAGSTTLIFQTMLPLLAAAQGRSTITLYGGTHNPMAPPAEYLSECFLPAIEPLGFKASCRLVRHGFYPKGGGAIRAAVEPWSGGGPLELLDETEWEGPEVEVLIANLPEHVAFREQEEAAKSLRIDPLQVKITALPGEVGPGNALMIRYRAAGGTALFASFGQPGKRAEKVAREGARQAKKFARSKAPVDPHLADQLLVPMALAHGGSFMTSEVTEHLRTNARVIESFLGARAAWESVSHDRWIVTVPGMKILSARPGSSA